VRIGTHAIVDAGFWPSTVSEKAVASRLLRSVSTGMLVMWDRGLWACRRIVTARERGAHVLCRLPAGVKPVREKPLSDGSWLVWIAPSDAPRIGKREKGERERLLVRLIEYPMDDPSMPGYGERYRVITTLLAPDLYPARKLAVSYHERWEIEITLDEIEVHQHLYDGPLRSRKPMGVIQELYGLLIAHFAIRSVMYDAAQRAGLSPDRLSFVLALRVIRDAVRDLQITQFVVPMASLSLPFPWCPMVHRVVRSDAN